MSLLSQRLACNSSDESEGYLLCLRGTLGTARNGSELLTPTCPPTQVLRQMTSTLGSNY